MARPSPSRRHAQQAAKAACDGDHNFPDRLMAADLAVAHALLELAHQIGRLADQIPVYGPPEEGSP